MIELRKYNEVTQDVGVFVETGDIPSITFPLTISVVIGSTNGNSITLCGGSNIYDPITFILDAPQPDAIISSLTTSLATYIVATNDDWVKITSTEYANLQTNVTGTVKAGISNAYLTAAATSGITNTDRSAICCNSSTIPNTPEIGANTYLYAFAVKYDQSNPIPVTDARVFTNANSASFTGFNQVGSILPALTTGGSGLATNYYVRKGVSAVNAGTAGLLSIFTGQTTNSALYLGVYLNNSVINDIKAQYFTPAATGGIPNSSSTLSTVFGIIGAVAIQGLTTATQQWA
jgi:hypothetical protein